MGNDILEEIRKLTPALKEKFGITKIALFGSYARNEARENSDIDLAIIEIDKKDFFNRLHAKYFIEEHMKKKVDIGYLESMRSFLRKRIEKEMIYV